MNNLNEHIENYLAGKLSPSEAEKFERQMQSDPELKSLVEDHRVANKILEFDYAKEISALVNKERKARTTRKYYRYAAGVVAVYIGLLGIFYPWKQKEDSYTPKGEKSLSQLNKQESVVIESFAEEKNNSKTIPTEEIKESKDIETNIEEGGDVAVDQEEKEAVAMEYEDQLVELETQGEEETETIIKEKSDTELITDKSENITNIPIQTNPCDALKEVKVLVRNSELGESNGRLKVDGPDGVKYQLNNSGSYEEINEFTYLSPEVYTVTGKVKGCEQQIGIYEINEAQCSSNKSLVFNPSYDTELVIALQVKDQHQVKIYDQKGTLVYQEELYGANEFRWTGGLDNGGQVDLGSYIVRINGDENYFCEYFVVVSK